jgi:hypothetical protein
MSGATAPGQKERPGLLNLGSYTKSGNVQAGAHAHASSTPPPFHSGGQASAMGGFTAVCPPKLIVRWTQAEVRMGSGEGKGQRIRTTCSGEPRPVGS